MYNEHITIDRLCFRECKPWLTFSNVNPGLHSRFCSRWSIDGLVIEQKDPGTGGLVFQKKCNYIIDCQNKKQLIFFLFSKRNSLFGNAYFADFWACQKVLMQNFKFPFQWFRFLTILNFCKNCWCKFAYLQMKFSCFH